MNAPTLVTPNVTLRAITRDDAPAIFAYASDPIVVRYVAFEIHRSIEDTFSWIDAVVGNDASSIVWGIIVGGNQFAGTIGLARINHEHERAEMGFCLAREHWGKGYATAAARAVLSFSFQELKLNRVEAFCRPENLASARVLEKSGMALEGTLRQRKRIKGELWDLKVYSMLRGEHDVRSLYRRTS